jgi:hypothetical protein
MSHLSGARAATRLGQSMTTIRGVVGALDADGEIASVGSPDRLRLTGSKDTMLDNTTKVTDWLKQNKGKDFCHACVGAATGVQPAQQVNQIIRPLGKAKDFRYMKTTCSECSADLMCVSYAG